MRITSWNICRAGRTHGRIDGVVEVLGLLSSDVIVLSEVTKTNVDVLRLKLEDLGYVSFWASELPAYIGGVVVATKLPSRQGEISLEMAPSAFLHVEHGDISV